MLKDWSRAFFTAGLGMTVAFVMTPPDEVWKWVFMAGVFVVAFGLAFVDRRRGLWVRLRRETAPRYVSSTDGPVRRVDYSLDAWIDENLSEPLSIRVRLSGASPFEVATAIIYDQEESRKAESAAKKRRRGRTLHFRFKDSGLRTTDKLRLFLISPKDGLEIEAVEYRRKG